MKPSEKIYEFFKRKNNTKLLFWLNCTHDWKTKVVANPLSEEKLFAHASIYSKCLKCNVASAVIEGERYILINAETNRPYKILGVNLNDEVL